MKTTQTLASGTIVRQDFRESVRFVMFETDDKIWKYATHGGTAFIVYFQGKYFGITCRHVLGDFNWRQIALTDEKFGREIAGLSSIYYPSNPTEAAKGSDILDVAVVEFSPDVDASFFKDCAYIVDDGTVGGSTSNDILRVNGALKDQSSIDGDSIAPVYALLEFIDKGPSSADPVLRKAIAQYYNPTFDRLTGLSGSPVFNATKGRLTGMVVRGGLANGKAIIWYIEISDVIEILNAINDGSFCTQYSKTITHPIALS